MSYDDDDDVGVIGTPFPALEADEIVSRRLDVDQTVRDERGRRRFHGAFTGGFSAGYWNTVGSAEGFTPKIFKSSRKDKFNKDDFSSKPEDFMDDEDFGSFGIAPKKIHTKDDFVENFTLSSLKDSHLTFDEVIRSVFQSNKESIGKRLFRKMKRTAKLEQKDLYDDDEPVDMKTDDSHSATMISSKINRHGLGYKGMLNSKDLDSTSDNKRILDSGNAVLATMKSGKRLKITGEAFGYGALEEDDAMDIYSHDDLSRYDFEIGPVATTNKTKPKLKKPFATNQNATEIDGFKQFKENFNLFQNIKRKYAPPELPNGWKPRKIVEISNLNRKSRWDNVKNDTTIQSEPKQQKILNANLRAVILGENVVHKSGVAKSEQSKELEFSKTIKPAIITANVPISKTPLSGYFASKFTRSSSTTIDEDQLTAGLNTFENVSSTSSLLSDKKSTVETNQTAENLVPIRTVYEWHPHKIVCKRFGVQNPFPQFPDVVGIVCMRESDKSLNMIARTNLNQEKKSLFVNIFSELNSTTTTTNDIQPSSSSLSNKTSQSNDDDDKTVDDDKKRPATDLRPEIVENTINETEQQMQKPRPPIDLFKSIFASDEEEEEEENPTDSIENDNSISKQQSSGGIFAGIDFDQLNQNFDPRLDSTKSNVSIDKNDKQNVDEDDDDECYGPALPPVLLSNPESTSMASSSIHMINNDKHSKHKKIKKSKKMKKSKKKKSSSSTSKHYYHRKRKRHRSRSSSSSSDSNNDDNNYNESNIDQNVEDKLIDFIKKIKHH
ncbi:G patch domain-containing protein 1 [Dermatophagoides farinae]|uniref:G patch domain-containing protein 1 n=1 Tax=Dermatophagoides farinae TaxID=6954 RepID=A0A922HMY6_DERFA|nr:hypothetical protein HUG17_0911 [Dermatophagoides farinae]KAH9497802.1 G patch domain-containing protein 1 [Dermatophagoides farinae]